MSNVKSLIRISAGLLVLGSIGVAGQVQAQTVDMPFDGNVPGSCTFGTITPGVLAKSPAPAPAVMATGGGLPVGGGPGVGTASKVTVNCTGASVLTVAVPTGTGPVGFTPAILQALVQKGVGGSPLDFASASVGGTFETGGSPWSQTNRTVTLPAGATPLTVSLAAGSGQNSPPPAGPLPTGNYSYKVNLSITGN